MLLNNELLNNGLLNKAVMIVNKKSILFYVFCTMFFISGIEAKNDTLKHLIDGLDIFVKTLTNKKAFFKDDFEISNWIVEEKSFPRSIKPIITWIGHSTFLIQINNLNIITDPVLFDLHFLYKRNIPIGIPLEKLPKIDIILISHDHADHLCKKSILYLKKDNPMIYAPQGTLKFFKKNKISKVSEFKWDEEITIIDTTFTFLKSLHWTGSNLFNLNKSLAGGWFIQSNDFGIYFAGDSLYSDHFLEIGKKFKNIDVALMPIGPNKPKKSTRGSHMRVKESVMAFFDLNAKHFIPMHWGTFSLGTDTFIGPIKKLKKEFCKIEKEQKLSILKFGQKKIFLS